MRPVLRTVAISFALTALLLQAGVLPSAWGDLAEPVSPAGAARATS